MYNLPADSTVKLAAKLLTPVVKAVAPMIKKSIKERPKTAKMKTSHNKPVNNEGITVITV